MNGWSTAGRVFHLAIAIIFTVILAALAFVWSLGQTIEFTQFMFPDDPNWGTVFGIAIQLGPQVFLSLASFSTGNMRLLWLALFWGFSTMDAATNIGARMDDFSFATGRLALASAIGIVLDIAVVFFEELIAYSLGVVFDDIAQLIEDMGGDPPGWLRVSSRAAHRLGTGSRKEKQQSIHNPKQNGVQRSPHVPDFMNASQLPMGQPKRESKRRGR